MYDFKSIFMLSFARMIIVIRFIVYFLIFVIVNLELNHLNWFIEDLKILTSANSANRISLVAYTICLLFVIYGIIGLIEAIYNWLAINNNTITMFNVPSIFIFIMSLIMAYIGYLLYSVTCGSFVGTIK